MNTHITTPPRIAHPSAPAQEAALLLKPRQLARRPGISRRTLSNWTQNKTVPMIKIGRFCRFEFDKVWAALQKHEQAAAGALDVLERCSSGGIVNAGIGHRKMHGEPAFQPPAGRELVWHLHSRPTRKTLGHSRAPAETAYPLPPHAGAPLSAQPHGCQASNLSTRPPMHPNAPQCTTHGLEHGRGCNMARRWVVE